MSNIISRSDRAKMRNQKKGYELYDEDNSVSQNKGKSNQYSNDDDITNMRDDEIAEMNQDDDYWIFPKIPIFLLKQKCQKFIVTK